MKQKEKITHCCQDQNSRLQNWKITKFEHSVTVDVFFAIAVEVNALAKEHYGKILSGHGLNNQTLQEVETVPMK